MSTSSSYFDPDAILTDAQKVPCTLELNVPGLGYLNNSPGSSVKAGTKVEAPLWLAEMLAVSKPTGDSSLASMDMPAALERRVMNALRADPKSVDLRAQGRWFYGLAARMLDLFEDEEIIEVLTETFKTRSTEIADKANNTRSVSTSDNEFISGLDESERQLFRAAHEGNQSVRRWFEKESRT
ncbi:GINS complex, Psf3 component [Polychaeton citri CBS 116435]|uniref:DNA replication complex GINS protein PSF3 n=1 Tax=Polychaeton citri CBS 116435 TaxID=1314669 RepID=A0A9P4UK89_9PEZI|nr:GINS complex, Psf3 component [Polychaeton citri CBS 116435]